MILKKLDRKTLLKNRLEMYDEYKRRVKKGKEKKVDIQTDLASKYGYKNQATVLSVINRIEGKIKPTKKKLQKQ